MMLTVNHVGHDGTTIRTIFDEARSSVLEPDGSGNLIVVLRDGLGRVLAGFRDTDVLSVTTVRE
jgi:hypothetical protein